MKKLSILVLFLTLMPAALLAQQMTEEETLTELLYEFLEGASYNDAAVHDRFWAEDLIYTGLAGNRITKEDIMDGVEENPDRSQEPEMAYHAEEVQIQLYGETAVVAFRLVGTERDGNVLQFYNTGTFVQRDGQWRAVAWQATRTE